jgi:hypothetical protein
MGGRSSGGRRAERELEDALEESEGMLLGVVVGVARDLEEELEELDGISRGLVWVIDAWWRWALLTGWGSAGVWNWMDVGSSVVGVVA